MSKCKAQRPKPVVVQVFNYSFYTLFWMLVLAGVVTYEHFRNLPPEEKCASPTPQCVVIDPNQTTHCEACQ